MKQIAMVLPPLRRYIVVQILKIVFLFGLLGIFLLTVIHLSGPDPKDFLTITNRKTSITLILYNTWTHLYLNNSHHNYSGMKNEFRIFDRSLASLHTDFSHESNESVTFHQIDLLWKKYELTYGQISEKDYLLMNELLSRFLMEIHDNSASYIENKATFASHMAVVSIGVFFVGLVVSIYFSEKFSTRIVRPLKKMTEILQNKPKITEKLKFPEPTSLEIQFLMTELSSLWKNLGEMHKENLKNLEAQEKGLKCLLAAMDDAILVIDAQGKVQHYNQEFARLIGLKDDDSKIEGFPWHDLPLVTDNYVFLSKLFAKSEAEETTISLFYEGQDHIYRMRKRFINENEGVRIGIVFLLHDITKKLPPEKRDEWIAKWKEKS